MQRIIAVAMDKFWSFSDRNLYQSKKLICHWTQRKSTPYLLVEIILK